MYYEDGAPGMTQKSPPTQMTPRNLPKLMKATYMGPSEDILWEGRPSAWLYFPGPVFVLFLAAVVNLYLMARVIGGPLGNLIPAPSFFPSFLTNIPLDSVPVILGLIFLLIAILFLGVRFFKRATTVYAVTSTRLIKQSGILSKDFDEIQLSQVRGIDVKQTGLERIFGFGTIHVSAEGGGASSLGNETWAGFPKPVKFQRTVETAQERLRGGGYPPQPQTPPKF